MISLTLMEMRDWGLIALSLSALPSLQITQQFEKFIHVSSVVPMGSIHP